MPVKLVANISIPTCSVTAMHKLLVSVWRVTGYENCIKKASSGQPLKAIPKLASLSLCHCWKRPREINTLRLHQPWASFLQHFLSLLATIGILGNNDIHTFEWLCRLQTSGVVIAYTYHTLACGWLFDTRSGLSLHR